MRFSLVRCSIDPARLAQSNAGYASAFGEEAFESIVIRDARSLADGYNRGLALAHGGFVILSHDDAWPVSPGAIARLASHLAEVDVVGVAGATRAMGSAWLAAGQPDTHGHILGPAPDGGVNGYFWGATADLVRGVKLLDGCFIAARADVARAIGFDETRFDGFHGYDADFCWRAHTAGHALGIASDVSVYHLSGGDFGPEWQRFDTRFVEAHGARLDAGIPGPQRKANARFDSVEQAVGRMALDVHVAIAQRLRG